MTDPYGRFHSPSEPPKPVLFSPTRPFRWVVWGWMNFMSVWLFNKQHWADQPFVFFTWLGMCGLLSIPCTWLGLFGLFIPVGFVISQVYFYFAFHINDEEVLEYWRDRLAK